jgi:hypothetical protein
VGCVRFEGTRGFKEPLAEHDVQVPVVDPRPRRHAIDETPHRGRLDWLDYAGIAETAASDVFVRGVAVAVDGGHPHILPNRELFSLLRCVATKSRTGMQLCRIRLYRVKGAGRAGARRPVCTAPWHPASGGTKLVRSARFDLVSERIAPVATVPVHHQRPFHAAVAHARATQPCRSIAPRTQASADGARQPRSVPSCSSNEASRS